MQEQLCVMEAREIPAQLLLQQENTAVDRVVCGWCFGFKTTEMTFMAARRLSVVVLRDFSFFGDFALDRLRASPVAFPPLIRFKNHLNRRTAAQCQLGV